MGIAKGRCPLFYNMRSLSEKNAEILWIFWKKNVIEYLCQLTEADEDGGMRFEIDKRRISIRLTAPYSEERRRTASQRGKEKGFGTR